MRHALHSLVRALDFLLEPRAAASENLVVDYVIDFVKANGRNSPEVYKLKRVKIEVGGRLILSRSHALKAAASTYTLRPGLHRLRVQVNGRVLADAEFTLI